MVILIRKHIDRVRMMVMLKVEEVRHQIDVTTLLTEAAQERGHLWRKIRVLQRRHEMSKNVKRSRGA